MSRYATPDTIENCPLLDRAVIIGVNKSNAGRRIGKAGRRDARRGQGRGIVSRDTRWNRNGINFGTRTRILTVRSSPRSIDRENGRVTPSRTNDQQQEGEDRTRRKSFLFHRFFPIHQSLLYLSYLLTGSRLDLLPSQRNPQLRKLLSTSA